MSTSEKKSQAVSPSNSSISISALCSAASLVCVSVVIVRVFLLCLDTNIITPVQAPCGAFVTLRYLAARRCSAAGDKRTYVSTL